MTRSLAAALFASLLAGAACGDPSIVVEVPFASVYVTPNDGSTVTASSADGLALFAAFNTAIDAGSTAGIQLLRTAPDAGTMQTEILASGAEVTVGHGPLPIGRYTLVFPTSLASAEGDPLPYEIRVDFEIVAD